MIIFAVSFIFLYLQTLIRHLVLQFHYQLNRNILFPLTRNFVYHPTNHNFIFSVNIHDIFFSYFHVYETSEPCMVSQLTSYKAVTISSMKIYLCFS